MTLDISIQQSKILKDVFDVFDTDQDGGITMLELNSALETLGQRVSQDELRGMMREAGVHEDGMIDLTDFTALYANKVNNTEENEEDLVETFKFYDLNNTGYITATNLMFAMDKMGCQLSPEEADEMIREADLDGDGMLDYRDFRRMMMRLNTTTPGGAVATTGSAVSQLPYQHVKEQTNGMMTHKSDANQMQSPAAPQNNSPRAPGVYLRKNNLD